MQIYALNKDYQRISAYRALRGQDYFCLECRSSVRLRGGHLLQLHFYHLRRNPACKQGGKSLEHLTLQLHIQKTLHPEKVFLEYRFDSIQRIADVFWPSKSLIFEIQCSPISSVEMEARQKDYASLGYQVIWILHERRFNKKRLSEAGRTVKFFPHYFTNMDAKGRGKIYDQWVEEKRGKQIKKNLQLPIDLTSPIPIPPLSLSIQNLFKNRTLWPLYFKGDLMDRALQGRFFHPRPKINVRKRIKTLGKVFYHFCINCLYALLNRTCD